MSLIHAPSKFALKYKEALFYFYHHRVNDDAETGTGALHFVVHKICDSINTKFKKSPIAGLKNCLKKECLC